MVEPQGERNLLTDPIVILEGSSGSEISAILRGRAAEKYSLGFLPQLGIKKAGGLCQSNSKLTPQAVPKLSQPQPQVSKTCD